jgi:hypothetical protein
MNEHIPYKLVNQIVQYSPLQTTLRDFYPNFKESMINLYNYICDLVICDMLQVFIQHMEILNI